MASNWYTLRIKIPSDWIPVIDGIIAKEYMLKSRNHYLESCLKKDMQERGLI